VQWSRERRTGKFGEWFLLGYLTTLNQVLYRRMMILDDEMERMYKKAVVAYSEMLFQPEGTEEARKTSL
jgi:hypothetical protein